MFLRRTIKSSDDIQLRILTTFKCLLIDIKKYIQHNQLQHFLQHDFFFYGKIHVKICNQYYDNEEIHMHACKIQLKVQWLTVM